MTDEAREWSAGLRCPTCDRPVSWLGNPTRRPFCSLTRRLIHLGGWLDETYRVPAPPLSFPTLPMAAPPADVASSADAPDTGD